jgi:hypothetical protein
VEGEVSALVEEVGEGVLDDGADDVAGRVEGAGAEALIGSHEGLEDLAEHFGVDSAGV